MATASGQRKAAINNSALFSQNLLDTQQTLSQTYGDGRNAVTQGRDAAIGALQGNTTQALGALGTGYDTASGAINSGYGQARTDTQAGIDLFNPWVQSGQAANTAQSDFLGLGGPEGAAAQQQALNTFRNATGYQDVLNSTSDAALRKSSVIGGLGGNQIDELGRLGAQLANQTGQQYFGNLGTVSQTGLQAAGQQQQGYGQLANQGIAQGGALAGLATDLGSKQAGLYSNLGSSMGSAFMGAGALENSNFQGLGNAFANAGQFATQGTTQGFADAGKAGDAAKQANQQTAINLGTTAVKAVMGLPSFGSFGGGSGTGGLY